MRRNGFYRPCAECSKSVYVRPCEEKAGQYKYCSRTCRIAAKAGRRTKLTWEDVATIRENYQRYSRKFSMDYFAKAFGVNRRSIYLIVNGLSWTL